MLFERKQVFLWGPVILWAGLIFGLSHTPDLKSGLDCDFILRKGAHMTEYLILTLLLQRAVRGTWVLSLRQVVFYSFAGAFLYAISDEFHQSFIAGRVGSPVDVMIDTVGIVAASMGAYMLEKILACRKCAR